MTFSQFVAYAQSLMHDCPRLGSAPVRVSLVNDGTGFEKWSPSDKKIAEAVSQSNRVPFIDVDIRVDARV